MALGEKGIAVLAVFTLFVLLISAGVIYALQSGERRHVEVVIQGIATDLTRATALTVERELNDALRTAITAAMYEAGVRGESKENVEQRVRAFINERIEAGWEYASFSRISVPLTDEESLKLEWLPGGGLRAYGWLGAEFEHVMGARAFGLRLESTAHPRFLRIENVARTVAELAAGVTDPNALVALEQQLNDNYACEGLRIELELIDGALVVRVLDLYGAKGVVL